MSGKPPLHKTTLLPHVQEKIKQADELNRYAFLNETDPVKKNEAFLQSRLMKMNAFREHKDYLKKVGTEGIAHVGTKRRDIKQLKGGHKRRTIKRRQLKRK